MTLNGTFNGQPGVFDIPVEPLIAEVQKQTQWKTREQMAEHLNVSLRTLDRLRQRKLIPFVKVMSEVRFNTKEVDEAIRKRRS